VVCDGRVTPKIFLARNKTECADHIRTFTYRFKKGGKLRIILLNQFAGNLPYSSFFVNDLVNKHDGRLQSSPDGPDRFPFWLPLIPFSPDLFPKPVPVTPELIGHEQILCGTTKKSQWRGRHLGKRLPRVIN